ncbi:GDP-fucose protein O-fucosyltransferase [Corchorus olitorius]|uniref:O-fucosyltransferase family protein n=1 Tax=Corchorus olitorius TaxID=93759 RepID=A0A1R3HPC7_9ROSI|nr:GDP-fucose protein O-fucosyltransferase [Corchorus olitorius]
MVVIARYLNVTLIVPLFDNGTYWNDNSTFADIYDLNYFITSLRDEVHIIEELPPPLKEIDDSEPHYSMVPNAFSSLTYYYEKVLPRFEKRNVVHFSLTDARLANNGLPDEVQKLRCRVNYEAMRFTQPIQETGQKIVRRLRENGPFVVLHLRYEKDMVSFTGCVEGLTPQEIKEVTEMRYSYDDWKHKGINSKRRRQEGSCPLTPEETLLVLQGLGIEKSSTIYIAAGRIYNEEKRMVNLTMTYPNLVRKEVVLQPWELRPFLNHADQMAALDYIVAIESDIFIPTFGGNMAKSVEGHRRYLGFKPTILLDRMALVKLIDGYRDGTLDWDEFSLLVKQYHEDRIGKPARRMENPDKPRYEDFFYANPQECLHPFPPADQQ